MPNMNTGTERVFVAFRSKDCPDSRYYEYYWFICRYIEIMYKVTKSNLIHGKFGDGIGLFKNFFVMVLNVPKTIMMEYRISYRDLISKYRDSIRN